MIYKFPLDIRWKIFRVKNLDRLKSYCEEAFLSFRQDLGVKPDPIDIFWQASEDRFDAAGMLALMTN